MSEPAPVPVPGPPRLRQALVALSYLVRVPLGLFVLWQILWMFGYNTLDFSTRLRKAIVALRKDGEDSGSGSQTYERITSLRWIGHHLDEWVRLDDNSELARALVRPKKVTEWWARRSGQEQGWSLFAPDTVTWTCFVRVELRWDDDLEPLRPNAGNLAPLALTGTAALRICDAVLDIPEPHVIRSPNEPKDIHRYLRLGKLRTRRLECNLETGFRLHGEAREDRFENWTERSRDKVEDEWRYLIVFLDWKVRRFLEQNPERPMPRQVILWSKTWNIPPDSHKPWDWIEQADERVVRWRPLQFPKPTSKDDLEVYLHAEGRFENKKPSQWIPPHLMPGVSD